MDIYIPVLVCSLVLFSVLNSGAEIVPEPEKCTSTSDLPAQKYNIQYGDSQNCPRSDSVYVLETLPGSGWDNLRNVAMGPVLAMNYSQCRMTSDRKFLIPDDVHVEALKESNVHVYSQLIAHFSNYTSTTSRTINVEAHAKFHIFSASGSYSQSYQSAKMRIVGDRSTVSRSELRFREYSVRSHPDSQLHPVFEDRVLDIASSVQANDSATARYLADLMVRDYGTHCVTEVEAGAVIQQEDQLNSSYVKTMDSDSNTIRASAGASFAGMFGGSVSYTSTVTHEQITAYLQSRVDTHTTTMGGPPFKANFSINKWIDGMDNNLVTVDRNGDPLYYVITTGALPQLPLDTIRQTAKVLEESVISYYAHNVYRGCTSIDSPNFSYIANLEDGSCKEPYTNHTFGGLYQTCTGGLCDKSKSQLNPKTQNYNCPEQYTAVLIYEGTHFQCVRRCKHFLWIKYDCYNDCSHSDTSPNAAHYEAYWCAATGAVEQSSGYLFGGVYTQTTNNPLTNDKSCPEHFAALQFGMELAMYVCVSDDDELGFRYSVPFAGFFSCQAGNPLALSKDITRLQSGGASGQVSLSAFMYSAGAQTWPKRCPAGYSQHLLAINEGCEINYCVQAHSLSQMALPVIKRPPFQITPDLLHNTTRLLVSSTGHLWMKLGGNTRWRRTQMLATSASMEQLHQIMHPAPLSPSSGSSHGGNRNADSSGGGHTNGDGSTATTTILLTVIGTVIIGVGVGVAGYFVVMQRRKREYRAGEGSRSGERSALLGPSVASGSYPPIGESDEHV